MFYRSVLLSYIFCLSFWVGFAKKSHKAPESDENDLGVSLIASLKDDVNLDLSVDEEYEDLRAELLAYQSALASVISRRSLMSTPCWQVGGICVNEKLCKGAKQVTQVAGCRDKHNVCCFAWNRYFVKDFRDKGIPNIAMPWKSLPQEYGGKLVEEPKKKSKKDRSEKLKNTLRQLKKKLLHRDEEDEKVWVPKVRSRKSKKRSRHNRGYVGSYLK